MKTYKIMKQLALLFFTLLAFNTINYAQFKTVILKGEKAEKQIANTQFIYFNHRSPLPRIVRFKENYHLLPQKFTQWVSNQFPKGSAPDFNFIKKSSDKNGFTLQTYQETINGIPVEFGITKAHIKDGKVVTYSGELYPTQINTETATISIQIARQKALNHIEAETYKWEVDGAEEHIKRVKKDPTATFFPKGEFVYIYKNNKPSQQLRLAYKFDIYSAKPLNRELVWIDATTGEVLYTNKMIHTINDVGSAQTLYSGTRTITTDKVSNNSYRLQESNRAGGTDIYTLDANHSTNLNNAQDITNNTNSWSNEAGLDAHWGAEEVVDFYWTTFSRNSIDGNGMDVYSFVHYDNNFGNAVWDGYEMCYGDGQNNTTPFVALDITGHEMTHGVSQHSVGGGNGFNYAGEPGAMNESFSDIFGNTVEHFARPNNWSWLVGEDLGFSIRNMANPNAQNKPDTYMGNYWVNTNNTSPANDYGGVHYNACVQDYWYYLMVEGGSGTNDNNDNYNITAIGWNDAIEIVYTNLTTYMSSNSGYSDARIGAIQAAIDIFGACSQQVITTTNAWYAVGVGNSYSGGAVTANFAATSTSSCDVPFTVSFNNTGTTGAGTTYTWDFGDGTASTDENPTHTYTNFGQYTVQLTTTPSSTTCGLDIETKTNYIDINSSSNCFNCDTINYPIPGSLTVYNANGGFMTGWNGYGDLSKANKFSGYGPYTHITGALIGFYGVYDSGNGAEVEINIWSDNAGQPGTVLQTITTSLQDLESSLPITGGTHQGIVQFTFPSPISVSDPYYLGIKMIGFTANDSLGLISNTNGDSPVNMAWEQENDNSWHDMAQNWGTTSLDLYISPIMTTTPPSAIPMVNQTTTCVGSTLTFDATASQNVALDGYFWYFPNGSISTTTDTIVDVTFNTPGTYYAILQTISGCSGIATDSIQYTINAKPTIIVSNTTNASICGGDGTIELAFTEINDGVYTINYDGGTFNNISITGGIATINTTAGNYNNITISNGNCISVNGVSASISDPNVPNEPIIITNNATCSADGSATISNYNGSTYSYTFIPSGPTIDVSGTINNVTFGTPYTVSTTLGSCISSEASFVLNEQLTTPNVAVTASALNICIGDSTQLTASGANNYSWNNGVGIGNNIYVHPTANN